MKNYSKHLNYNSNLFTWKIVSIIMAGFCFFASCTSESSKQDFQGPSDIIDLGTIVTEDLPERIWGKAMMASLGFNRSNQFNVIEWEFDMENGRVSGSNAYYTLFNHGGPHIDAPNHMDLGGGLDTYPIESFMGPLKVFDVKHFPKGRTVPVEVFKDKVLPGDIVLIYTQYTPPQSVDAFPEVITLAREASEYLASIPVRAYGTDAFSVASLDDTSPVEADSETARAAPIHHSFLSRGIPIYEGLFQVEKLLAKQNMYFVGVPLNIKDGDGMLVRPVVFVF
jgi:kynurenine formamidase